MNEITISMKRQKDRKVLSDLLDLIHRTNRAFTITFIKQNGEPRIINGVSKNYKDQKGTGTSAMTAKTKRENHNIFQCYEVQITKAEKALAHAMHADPKVIGFKSIQIDNIEKVVFAGKEYVVTNNSYVLKPDEVAKYIKTIQGNLQKEAELSSRNIR